MRVKRIAWNCKENPQLWSKFTIVSIFNALKYIQKCHKTIWQPIQQKYSELEGDSFYPPMIRVCRFDGIYTGLTTVNRCIQTIILIIHNRKIVCIKKFVFLKMTFCTYVIHSLALLIFGFNLRKYYMIKLILCLWKGKWRLEIALDKIKVNNILLPFWNFGKVWTMQKFFRAFWMWKLSYKRDNTRLIYFITRKKRQKHQFFTGFF